MLIFSSDTHLEYHLDDINICPMCQFSIEPKILRDALFKNTYDEEFISILYLCRHCSKTFVAQYTVSHSASSSKEKYLELWCMGRKYFTNKKFEKKIEDLSPNFVKIYNEALQAEELNLLEIAGVGYRKAIEFLIKDFYIKLNPSESDKDKIIKLKLGHFFDERNPFMVFNDKLNATAQASVWLGNDFTHFYRLHTDYDIFNLKEFIDSAVYHISLELNYYKAKEFTKR